MTYEGSSTAHDRMSHPMSILSVAVLSTILTAAHIAVALNEGPAEVHFMIYATSYLGCSSGSI